MGRFDSEAGLCHLVFANEDTYYSRSLFKLNLRQYLYYELRWKGYDAVYFISGDESGYDLTAADQYSLDVYEEYEKQSLFDFLKGKSSRISRPGQRMAVDSYEQLLLKMIQMMKKEKEIRVAFVFTIESFSGAAAFPDIVPMLCRLSEKNYSRGHLILIQAPTAANGSRAYLADEEGIFRSDLFPEIRRIFLSRKNVRVYERLREELGQRVSFLNTLEREDLYRMVLRFLTEQCPGRKELFAKARDYGDFIWGWYHSQEFKEKAGPLFPENEKRLVSRIYTSLNDKSVFGKMDEYIAVIRSKMVRPVSLGQWIMENDPPDSWQRLIYEDNVLLTRLEQLPLAKTMEKAGSFSADWMERALKRIRVELQKPGLAAMDPQAEEYGRQCIEAMKKACFREDVTTLEKAVTALEYGVCSAMAEGPDEGEDQDIRRQLYLEIVRAAQTLKDTGELYEQDSKRIEEYTNRMRQCIRQIRSFEEQNPSVVKEAREFAGNQASSPGLQLLTARKSEAVGLRNDIRNLEYLRTSKMTMMNRCRENIQKLEMAVSTVAVGNVSHLRETMDYTAGLIRSASQENHRLMEELSKAPQEPDFQWKGTADFRDMTARGQAEVAEEFEEIRREQEGYRTNG